MSTKSSSRPDCGGVKPRFRYRDRLGDRTAADALVPDGTATAGVRRRRRRPAPERPRQAVAWARRCRLPIRPINHSSTPFGISGRAAQPCWLPRGVIPPQVIPAAASVGPWANPTARCCCSCCCRGARRARRHLRRRRQRIQLAERRLCPPRRGRARPRHRLHQRRGRRPCWRSGLAGQRSATRAGG